VPESDRPGDLPPDLPPEYAEAYRRGFERALRGASEDEPAEHPTYLSTLAEAFESAQARDAVVSVRRDGPRDRPAWLAPALLGALALVLLLSAYGLGKVFSGSVSGANVSPPKSSGQLIPNSGQPTDTHPLKGARYHGPTQVAPIAGVSASCTAPQGVDAGGHKVSYTASKVYDGDMSTAWRCDGSGVGQKLTIDLPSTTGIGEVGLIPGYAKTDPTTGANRYAQNNRITRVRWTFSDGASLDQTLNGSPKLRDMQSVRIPKTTADRVVIDILASVRGPRNTVAVSEVRLGEIPN
jgi:hypothetical protein